MKVDEAAYYNLEAHYEFDQIGLYKNGAFDDLYFTIAIAVCLLTFEPLVIVLG